MNQHTTALPVSVMAVRKATYKTRNTTLTQQETEQLSQYASDDAYVQKQKEDISELASMFRDMMGVGPENDDTLYISDFEDAFKAQPGTDARLPLPAEVIQTLS